LLHRTNLFCVIAGEGDQTLLAAGVVAASDSKVESGAASDTALASSSPNVAMRMIAKKVVPMLCDYWKKSTVTKADLSAYHTAE
jgi:hypothetical protein